MKNNQKISVSGKIIEIIGKIPKDADEVKKELKDRFGYSVKVEDVKVNLLYLLRREKINRKKEGSIYKYFI